MNPTQVLRTGVLVLTIHPFLGFLAAQGIGAMQYIPLREKPHKAKLEMTTGWPSLCTEDHVYTFETAREGLSPIYKYFGYAFDRKAGTVAAVRNMGLPEVKNIAPVESFFIAGDRPAYVQRTWDKDAGEVGLSAQLLDPATLLPDGDPVRIAKIPLDPKGYVHTLSLGVEVLPSPDGTKLLFCYDRVQSGGMQVVMLWVTDTKLQPVWSGMYKVPTQALGYQRDVLFDDAGRVYLKVNAILLDGDDVKVRSDGTQKVKVKANYANKRTHTWFRMHEKDYRMWDGVLPDGRVPESLGMALSNGGLSLGGFVEEDGAWEWVTLRLDDGFGPVDMRKGALGSSKVKNLPNAAILPDGMGGTFIRSLVDTRGTLLLHVDGSGRAVAEKIVDGLIYYDEVFVDQGRLNIVSMGSEGTMDAFAKEQEWKGGGSRRFAHLVTLAGEGTLSVERIVPAERADKNYLLMPTSRTIGQCGSYTAFTHEGDDPGLIIVDLR